MPAARPRRSGTAITGALKTIFSGDSPDSEDPISNTLTVPGEWEFPRGVL
jgi:hypothetical protein